MMGVIADSAPGVKIRQGDAAAALEEMQKEATKNGIISSDVVSAAYKRD
jgi:hypothetical protein